jgi:hypothetical protein
VARRHQRIRRARRVGRGGRAGISVSVAPGVSGAAGAASGAPLRSSGSARRAFFCACGVWMRLRAGRRAESGRAGIAIESSLTS